jgi:hypothetical protein
MLIQVREGAARVALLADAFLHKQAQLFCCSLADEVSLFNRTIYSCSHQPKSTPPEALLLGVHLAPPLSLLRLPLLLALTLSTLSSLPLPAHMPPSNSRSSSSSTASTVIECVSKPLQKCKGRITSLDLGGEQCCLWVSLTSCLDRVLRVTRNMINSHLCARSRCRRLRSSSSLSAKMGADQAWIRSRHLERSGTIGNSNHRNQRWQRQQQQHRCQ